MTTKEQIAAFLAAQNTANDQQDAIIDELLALGEKEVISIDGITKDVAFQADLITKLQAGQDNWTPEDQANLDALQARTQTALTKLTAFRTASQDKVAKLQALDAITNPEPPAQV